MRSAWPGAGGRGRLMATACPEVTIDSDAGELPVGVDGEALVMGTPIRCTIRPAALRVRVPRNRPGALAPRTQAGVDRPGADGPAASPGGGVVSEGPGAQPPDAELVVLAHISDLHFGAHDALAAESLVADLHAVRPHVVVVTGDLTQRARPREFAAAAEFLRRLPSPRLVVLGNHDVPLDRVSSLGPGYRRYLQQVGLAVDPVLDAGGVRILGLHSMPRWRWKSGHVSKRQAELVTESLSAARPGAVRVLALHHPITATGVASVAGRARLLAALAESRAELVLAGHTHRPATTWFGFEAADSPGCVLEGIAGSATSTRLRGVPRSWTLYRIDRRAITVEERHEEVSSAGSGWTPADVRRFRAPLGGRDGRTCPPGR